MKNSQPPLLLEFGLWPTSNNGAARSKGFFSFSVSLQFLICSVGRICPEWAAKAPKTTFFGHLYLITAYNNERWQARWWRVYSEKDDQISVQRRITQNKALMAAILSDEAKIIIGAIVAQKGHLLNDFGNLKTSPASSFCLAESKKLYRARR